MTVKVSKRRADAGFTLLELLVVIGIIVVLVGLLFPAISVVRNSSYAAVTQSRIAGLIQAIQQYQQQFSALPGPIPNAITESQSVPGQINGNPLLSNDGKNISIIVTSSQNITLGLLGGLAYSGSHVPIYYYDPTALGHGPSGLNPNNPKQFLPSIDNATGRTVTGTVTTAAEAYVPEFMDAFPIPMPILYLRANQGMTTAVDAATPSKAQYSLNDLTPYASKFYNPPTSYSPLTWTGSNQPFNYPAITANDAGWPGSYNYFVSASTGVVHQKDGYILMAAGKSRLYGNNDNLTSFGNPGQ